MEKWQQLQPVTNNVSWTAKYKDTYYCSVIEYNGARHLVVHDLVNNEEVGYRRLFGLNGVRTIVEDMVDGYESSLVSQSE